MVYNAAIKLKHGRTTSLSTFKKKLACHVRKWCNLPDTETQCMQEIKAWKSNFYAWVFDLYGLSLVTKTNSTKKVVVGVYFEE